MNINSNLSPKQSKPISKDAFNDMEFSIQLKQKRSLVELVNFIFDNTPGEGEGFDKEIYAEGSNHRIAINVTNNEGKLLFGIRLENKEGVKLIETSLYAPTPGVVVNFIQYLRKAFIDNSLSDD